MMETADTRQGPRWAWFGRAWFNWLACRRGLLQADVRSVIVGTLLRSLVLTVTRTRIGQVLQGEHFGCDQNACIVRPSMSRGLQA